MEDGIDVCRVIVPPAAVGILAVQNEVRATMDRRIIIGHAEGFQGIDEFNHRFCIIGRDQQHCGSQAMLAIAVEHIDDMGDVIDDTKVLSPSQQVKVG